MLKVFSIGILLGLIASGATAFFMPVADLHRETSLLTVQPNGGVIEIFKIRIPEDRVMVGSTDAAANLPGTLRWPQDLTDAGVTAEIFKLRNDDGAVIGLASRMVGSAIYDFGAAADSVEWVLNLPSRGSLYFLMDADADAAGNRGGFLRAGTREFSYQKGTMIERVVDDASTGSAYIELTSLALGKATDDAAGVAQ
ncbi:MAG: hypothetical protein HKN35_12550 [Woeseia sp.]|nr:hypothetical protein [Woeseia sp.]MBT8095833.1 hypothetical protein [Woeseia sp.]NNE61717.1 hypothetical protein [Woeseia sp.]NNL55087.1 hypothetical protein [Woeseia sp.]